MNFLYNKDKNYYDEKLKKYDEYLLNNDNYKKLELEELECNICMDDKEYFVKLDCNHKFCRDCLIKLDDCAFCKKMIDKVYNSSILIKQ
jgi:hypothetical protein